MTAPAVSAPTAACDCHTHIFEPGTGTAYPPAYPLPNAPYDAHRAMLAAIGVDRAVLVQPSAYGADHGVIGDAIARDAGRLRGVGLLGKGATGEDFDRLERAGIRALRFVETRVPGTGERYPGNYAFEDFVALRDEMACRGWHAEIWAPLGQAAELCDAASGRGVPIVLDHLAGATASTRTDDPAFARILKHVTLGDVWVKLVLCRTASRLDDALATRPLHEALIAANPDRLLWGTDFPFIRKGADAPDPQRLVELALEWTGAHANRIFAENPKTLYRFH